MPGAVPHPHHHRAPLLKRHHNGTVLPDEDLLPRQKLAVNGKVLHLAKLVEPFAQKHHGHAGGAVFPELALVVVRIQTVQHDVLYNIRRNFLPAKQVAHGVEQRGGAAVVFRGLIIQWIFHRALDRLTCPGGNGPGGIRFASICIQYREKRFLCQ
ncbi:hypothetical protein SDC9_160328 [bioreactor metagenome]|uniref:Uncharacterized protein n=1 Tax=bioreactor metagenome TaxID=1076179 RepID=A0A645FF33_9ZZZZ